MEDQKVFEVLYDFDGKESAEISNVAAGDIVIAPKQESREEWILILTLKTPRMRGYVPITYLKEIAGPEAANYLRSFETSEAEMASGAGAEAHLPDPVAPPPSSIPTAPSSGAPGLTSSGPSGSPLSSPPANPAASSSSSSLASPGAMARKPSFASATPMGASATTGLSSALGRSVPRKFTPMTSRTGSRPVAGESFNEMFARHEHYFKQVMRQREESFKKLESAMQAAAQDIHQCQEKNAKLSQRIMDLDGLIEEERKRWKERLEAEKKTLLMKGAAAGLSPVATGMLPSPSASS